MCYNKYITYKDYSMNIAKEVCFNPYFEKIVKQNENFFDKIFEFMLVYNKQRLHNDFVQKNALEKFVVSKHLKNSANRFFSNTDLEYKEIKNEKPTITGTLGEFELFIELPYTTDARNKMYDIKLTKNNSSLTQHSGSFNFRNIEGIKSDEYLHIYMHFEDKTVTAYLGDQNNYQTTYEYEENRFKTTLSNYLEHNFIAAAQYFIEGKKDIISKEYLDIYALNYDINTNDNFLNLLIEEKLQDTTHKVKKEEKKDFLKTIKNIFR